MTSLRQSALNLLSASLSHFSHRGSVVLPIWAENCHPRDAYALGSQPQPMFVDFFSPAKAGKAVDAASSNLDA